MALLRPPGLADERIVLESRRLYLRPPAPGDFLAWSQLREASRAFLTPWEPVWPNDDLTRPAYRRRLRRYAQEMREDSGYCFFIFLQEDNQIAGGLSLSNVRRGVTQSCSIGYWMGAPFAGKGLMSEAVRAVFPFVFDRLGLHRLEAACVPENGPSKSVLARTGFQEEGHARRYLRINGVWRDHLLFALLDSDAPARQPAHMPARQPSLNR